MNSHFDQEEAPFECPRCGKSLPQTIGYLKTNPTIECPRCGASTEIDAKDLARADREANEAVNDLTKSIERIGRNL